MARGRIFRITKAQAHGYDVLEPPRIRGSAKPNPGVTAIMGITNGRGAAKRAARKAKKSVRMYGGIGCPQRAPKRHRMAGATKRSDYALPQCFHYPVRTRGKASKVKILRALTRYGTHKHRYSAAVRRTIERGIARAAKQAGMTSPMAMHYRRKFAMANANQGENPMFVVPSASPNRKKKGKKSTKRRSRKVSPAHAFFMYPSKKAGFVGATASPNKKRKAAKKGTRKPKFGSPAWRKKYARKIAAGRRKAGKVKKGQGSIQLGRGKRIVIRHKYVGKGKKKTRSFRGAAAFGMKAARVTRGKGKGKRRSLNVFMRNLSILPAVPNKRRGKSKKRASWHKRMTRVVANAYRRARRNEAGEEPDWADVEDRPAWEEHTASPAEDRKAARAAAAAAAEGKARDAFKTEEDYAKWFGEMWKSPWFRKIYNAHRRGMAARKPKRGKKMAKKHGKKAASRKPRKGKARKGSKKSRKTRKGKRSHAWYVKIGRKGGRAAARKTRKGSKKRRGAKRSSAKRRSGGRKPKFGTKAFAKRYAKKAAATRKRNRRRGGKARRNFGFAAIPNMLIERVKAMAIPGLVALGGYAAHRLVTQLVTKALPMASNISSPLGGLAAFAAGVWALNRFLPQHALAGSLGMAVSFGALLLKTFLPNVATYLGMGAVGYQGQRVVYGMQGPQFLQAAAGPQFLQAAAGPQFLQAAADYYQPASGIGEYVSDGSLAPVSDFGEYVASNLDVSGWGDYEVSQQYQTGADGYGAINDGISPSGNLDQQFNIMEAAAGLGLSSPGTSSTYVPHEGARMVASAESTDSSGVFDVGGGNGVLG